MGLTAIVLIAGFLHVTSAEPQCHLIEIQNCVTKGLDWFKTMPRASLVESEADADSFCSALDTGFTCAFNYRDKCMTPIQKELLLLLQDGVMGLKDDFCTKGSSTRTNYLSHATCINKVSRSDETKEDIEFILATLEKLMSVPDKDMIKYACCGYKKMLNSISKQLHDTCGEDTVNMVSDMITTAVAQLPGVMCNDVEGTEDSCTAVLPPKGSKPTDDIKGTAMYQYVQDVLKNWLER